MSHNARITIPQLKELLIDKREERTALCLYVTHNHEDWCHFVVFTDDQGYIMAKSYDGFYDYSYLGTFDKDFVIPLDSHLLKSNDMPTRMAKELAGALYNNDTEGDWYIEPFCYCKLCKRRLYSFRNMLVGFGKECSRRQQYASLTLP